MHVKYKVRRFDRFKMIDRSAAHRHTDRHTHTHKHTSNEHNYLRRSLRLFGEDNNNNLYLTSAVVVPKLTHLAVIVLSVSEHQAEL